MHAYGPRHFRIICVVHVVVVRCDSGGWVAYVWRPDTHTAKTSDKNEFELVVDSNLI